jgi:hypothetical protein
LLCVGGWQNRTVVFRVFDFISCLRNQIPHSLGSCLRTSSCRDLLARCLCQS